MDGNINNKRYSFLIGTGVTKTIVKKKIVSNQEELLKSRQQPLTATSGAATVHGEAELVQLK